MHGAILPLLSMLSLKKAQEQLYLYLYLPFCVHIVGYIKSCTYFTLSA